MLRALKAKLGTCVLGLGQFRTEYRCTITPWVGPPGLLLATLPALSSAYAGFARRNPCLRAVRSIAPPCVDMACSSRRARAAAEGPTITETRSHLHKESAVPPCQAARGPTVHVSVPLQTRLPSEHSAAAVNALLALVCGRISRSSCASPHKRLRSFARMRLVSWDEACHPTLQ